MRGFRGFTVIALLIVVGGTAMAAPQDDGERDGQLPAFGQADADAGSLLSFPEARKLGISEERFQREDLDRDGKLTKYDYRFGIR